MSATGMTLVELLVVIVLVTTLVTTAIPILSPAGDGRKIREGSRLLNTMISGAQARAIETGRPHGVALKRLSADTLNADDNGVCVEAYYVEVPPVYAGIDTASRVRVSRRALQIGPALNINSDPEEYEDRQPLPDATPVEYQLQFLLPTVDVNGRAIDGMPSGWAYDLVPPRFFRVGDTIDIAGVRCRFINPAEEVGGGQTGRALGNEVRVEDGYFEGVGVDGNAQRNAFVVRPVARREIPFSAPVDVPAQNLVGVRDPDRLKQLALGVLNVLPAPAWSEPMRYGVYRQPTVAYGQPVQMPSGVAIDLQASGLRGEQTFYRPGAHWDPSENQPALVTEPLVLMFSSNGTMQTTLSYEYVEDEGPGGIAGFFESSAQPDQLSAGSGIALLVGRRDAIPAEPDEDFAQQEGERGANEPLLLPVDGAELTDETLARFRENYNWLSPDSRWVVIGGRSGAVSTAPNVSINWRDLQGLDVEDVRGRVDSQLDLAEQLLAVREGALLAKSGGR